MSKIAFFMMGKRGKEKVPNKKIKGRRKKLKEK